MPTRNETAFHQSADPEETFCAQLRRELPRRLPARTGARDWQAEPFRPLLLGYSGRGNVGADLRVREMIRQFEVIFGHVGFSPWLTRMGHVPVDPVLDALQVRQLDGYFPDVMAPWIEESDGVIACEGSMFTSRFSDILSATFAAGLGHAAAVGKLAVAYGAESGSMSPRLESLVRDAVAEGLVLSRSRTTHEHMRSLGLRSRLGADTAWTYDPSDEARRWATDALHAAGWDGERPVAILCPMNPWCWPIRVDFPMAAELAEHGWHKEHHYDGVLFHSMDEAAKGRYDDYVQALATTVNHLHRHGHFVAIVGMEKLDAPACQRVADAAGELPVFVSGAVTAERVVALLRTATTVTTSRFHAAVLAMAAGVRTVGIALDERIRNLFAENGLGAWFVRCDTPDLAQELVTRLDRITTAPLQATYDALLASQVRAIGDMGLRLHDEALRTFPSMPAARLPRDWRAFLPPVSARVRAALDDTIAA